MPKDEIVKSEDEKPAKIEMGPEEGKCKDKITNKQLHAVDHDMYTDGIPGI